MIEPLPPDQPQGAPRVEDATCSRRYWTGLRNDEYGITDTGICMAAKDTRWKQVSSILGFTRDEVPASGRNPGYSHKRYQRRKLIQNGEKLPSKQR
jgi:hypothetical protein